MIDRHDRLLTLATSYGSNPNELRYLLIHLSLEKAMCISLHKFTDLWNGTAQDVILVNKLGIHLSFKFQLVEKNCKLP